MATPNEWELTGEYFETCSCDYLCPCIFTNLSGKPTKGWCVFAMVFQIQRGRFGSEALDGLSFAVVGRTPGTLTGIIVVGGNSYLSELMGIAGGVNAFADSTAAYPKVTLEEVLARDPDVILDRADMADQSAATQADKRAVINLWRAYPKLKAVKHDRVVFGISDIFFVPGPRIVDAAQAFAKMLHPEVKW